MEEAIKYKNVIREYFLEYKNRDQVLKSIFYVILFGASFLPFVFGSAKEGLGYIWLTFPMALALFAAITHTSALPTMLYLVPGSKKLREEYIRRMLKVKIGLPLALCAVIDIILLIVQPMMIKGVILQLVTVFFMSYCVGITVAISLVNPLLIEEAIDHYIAQSDLHGLIGLGIFALVLNLIFIVMVKLRMYAMAVISNKILLQIRQDLYEHIQTLSFSFFDSRPTGKILARIIGDVNSLKDVLVNVVTTLVPEFVTVVGVVVIMLVKDWRLALASLSTIPLMIAGIWFVQTASHKRWQIFRKKASNLNAYVHEDIAGMNVVQSFAAEDETQEIFEGLTDEHQKSFVDAVTYADMFGPVIDFCWGIGAMMLYLVGIRFLGFEKVSVGLLVAFGTYINMFWNPIMNFLAIF